MDDIDIFKYMARISEACGIICKRMDKLEHEVELLKHEESTPSEGGCKIYDINDFKKDNQLKPIQKLSLNKL